MDSTTKTVDGEGTYTVAPRWNRNLRTRRIIHWNCYRRNSEKREQERCTITARYTPTATSKVTPTTAPAEINRYQVQ